MKKILALVLALMLVLGMTSAFAATITINRDSSWDENAESAFATYTYYKIFDAVITSAADVDADTGALTGSGNVVYTVDSLEKAQALPSIFKVNGKAPANVTATDASSDNLFYVTLADSSTGAAAIVTALKTMVAENTTIFPGTAETSDEETVVIDGLPTGYYLIEASNGKDLAVQTLGDVTIKEKNDYPTIDKKQKQADDPDYTEAVEPAEIGSYIDYKVTVHVPADATKAIKVFDTMSTGLAYDSTAGLTVTPSTATYTALTSSDTEYDANATWQIVFADSVVQSLRGSDIVITYRAQVTADALTVDTRKNEAKLSYDEGNYILKDDVDFTTYFAGIYKVDPNDGTADMSGVKFVLKDKDGKAVNVTYVSEGGYYVVDASSESNEVETRADGTNYTIKIRGLDDDLKAYTLTETETKNGYNLLANPAELTLIEDKGTAFSGKAANTYDRVENNKGTQLPSTGGVGTTIFYVVGGILVLGAVIFLVTKRRMGSND